MDDTVAKSLELEKQLNELTEEFERGVRAKELIMNELGITPAKLAAFEGKLTPQDQKVLADKKREMEEELEKAAPLPQTPVKQTKFRDRGIRI